MNVNRYAGFFSVVTLMLTHCIPAFGAQCSSVIAGSEVCSSITQRGITWEFDTDYIVGQFVTGDYWVLDSGGGVKITGISPGYVSSPRDMNGSMLDPGSGTQGYDSWWSTNYDRVKNVGIGISASTPLIISGSHSLVSTISNEICGGDGHISFVKTASILTTVTVQPPIASFRPGAGGTTKKIYQYSQVKFDRLKSLATNVTTPTKSFIDGLVTDKIGIPWLVHSEGFWQSRYMRPSDGLDNYYYTGPLVAGGLWLHSSASLEDKNTLAIRLIQMGIDIYSYVDSGVRWYADGGHYAARQFLVVLAGVLLDSPDMYNIGVSITSGLGNEGDQTFYVSQSDVDFTPPDVHLPYTTAMIGMPEWMDKLSARDSNWVADYREIGSGAPAWGSEVTALALLGAVPVFNRPAFFDYMERYMALAKGDQDPFGYTVPNQSVLLARGGSWGQSMYDTYFQQYKGTDFRSQRRLFRNVRVGEVEP